MIETPTCFILGAGASVDAGFLVGRDLRDMIYRDLLHHDHQIKTDSQHCERKRRSDSYQDSIHCMLRLAGHDNEVIRDFGTRLRASGSPSVDFFLMSSPSFMELGKAAIAAALMKLENEDELLYQDRHPHANLPDGHLYASRGWYSVLWELLYEGCESSPDDLVSKNDVSFITFNYERSLEHFLHVRLRNTYESCTAAHFAKLFPVVHVHGAIGAYPTVGSSGPHRQYAPGFQRHSVSAYSEEMHIAPDKIPPEVCREIAARLGSAARLVFLGFAYAAQNLDKLPMRPNRYKELIAGRTFMDERDLTRSENELNGRVIVDNPPLYLSPGQGCIEILRTYVV